MIFVFETSFHTTGNLRYIIKINIFTDQTIQRFDLVVPALLWGWLVF